MQQKHLKILISGGGTGGHIFPAVAIANALKIIDPQTEILFVGATGRMEMEKVPAAGYKIVGLDIVGLQRRLTVKNFLVPFKLLKSMLKARKILKEFKPDAVVGVGGYASGPTLQMAAKMKIPTLIQEQNSYPGITNKILASKVQKICVAYDNMEKFFPKKKIILTGNPIRQDIINTQNKRDEALRFFELDTDKKTLLVVGGSLGALTINKAVAHFLDGLEKLNIQVVWQTGKSYFPQAVESAKNYTTVHVNDFITRMDLAYAAADFIVSRAGAIAISELCVVHKPMILIPSPNVTEDHQTKNAMALVNKNAAVLLKDIDAQQDFLQVLTDLLTDDIYQESLSEASEKMAKTDAAHHIATEIIAIAKSKK